MKNMSPLTLMLLCLFGMVMLHRLFPLASISSWTLLVFGIGVIAFGLVMAVGAEGQFRRRGTTVDHQGISSKLVTDGWFKYSRNPMYLSLLLLLAGAWLSLGSLSPFLIIPMFIIIAERRYILHEENRLLATFGKEYQFYQRRTRRWL